MAKKTYIHVNQHVIKANAKTGATEPPLTVKDYRENRRATEVIILDRDSREVARVVYRPNDPLSCGARVWIETTNEVVTLTNPRDPVADAEALATIEELMV